MMVVLFIISMIALLYSTQLKNKSVGIIIAFVFMIILISGDYTNLDYENYIARYNPEVEGNSLEWGFAKLILLFYNTLGIKNYDIFRLITTTLAIFIFYFSINRYISNKNKYFCDIILLFIISPFFWESPVHRNFLSATIFMFSIRFLESYNIKNLIFFVLSIILASSIQTSFYFYMIFVLVYFLRNKKNSKWIKTFIILLFILTLMPGMIMRTIQSEFINIDDNRGYYWDAISTRYGYILFIAEQFIIFYVARYGYKLTMANIKNVNTEKKQSYIGLIESVYYMSILSFSFCVLYRIQANFVRLLINQIPLIYLQYACVKTLIGNHCNICVVNKYNSYTKLIFCFAILFFILILSNHWNDIITPEFTHNWIIEAILN